MVLMDDDAMIEAMMIDQTTTASETDKKNNKNNGSSLSIRPGRRGVRRGYNQGAAISSSYTMTDEEDDATVINIPTKTNDGPSSSPTLQKPEPPKQ